jgi:hypothetical protein
MKDVFKDYLFSHRILVNDMKYDVSTSIHFNAVITLANNFAIRVKSGANLATVQMIHDAERNLGLPLSEPFYRGFPDTVRRLTSDQLLYDQLLHYTQTYGMGWFDDPGHSVLEGDLDINRDGVYDRLISEHADPRDFTIMDEVHAKRELFCLLDGLCKSTRPLNIDQQEIILEAYKEYGPAFISEGFASKYNAAFFYYKTKDLAFANSLRIQDTIKLLEIIQYNNYQSENLKKLNLKNQDRKLIAKLLDYFFEREGDPVILRDVRECFEKRKLWQGLLHHIHYKPANHMAENYFLKPLRESSRNMSAYAEFEAYMGTSCYLAAKALKESKGTGALIRNLNYILSRCVNDNEVEEVLSCLE